MKFDGHRWLVYGAHNPIGVATRREAASGCFSTIFKGLSAIPLHLLAPASHFSTVLSRVFKQRANTGWLI
ncbi:MAG: hypothetical protein JWO52_2055 [Gammaproteobacteria bacterium]|nr:hypothetical protein [Gammaproteobacteria bacterium]